MVEDRWTGGFCIDISAVRIRQLGGKNEGRKI